MEVLFRYFSAIIASLCSLLCPIAPLISVATFFIVVDFITGVLASRAVAVREGREWWFESRKAWRTILKAGFVAIAIVMMWIVDHHPNARKSAITTDCNNTATMRFFCASPRERQLNVRCIISWSSPVIATTIKSPAKNCFRR